MASTTDRFIDADSSGVASSAAPVVVLDRRKIDSVLVLFGAVVVVVLVIAGALLTWGNRFSTDYVASELGSQNITFPTSEELLAEGRGDLTEFGGERLTNGQQAEAYASYINGHLDKIAAGQTFADLGDPERDARAALAEATEAGAPAAEIAELTKASESVSGTRNTLFKGETLRGLLLSAYAWSVLGTIAGLAAIAAFVAASAMAVLVVMGTVRMRRAASMPPR